MEESTQIQVVPPAFTGASREVDPGACFEWLRQGWQCFSAAPGLWMVITAIWVVVMVVLNVVPLGGAAEAAPVAAKAVEEAAAEAAELVEGEALATDEHDEDAEAERESAEVEDEA